MTGSRILLLKLPFEIQAPQEVRLPPLQSSRSSATLPKLFFVCFLHLIPRALSKNPHCVKAWGQSRPGRLYFSSFRNQSASVRGEGSSGLVIVFQPTRPLSSCWGSGSVQTKNEGQELRMAFWNSTEGEPQVRSVLRMTEMWVFKSCRK